MTQVKKAIEIVQYHEGLAKEIAKMWNMSRDGWGGDTRVMTEEEVKQKEAHSDNIELYLAIDGEEVVGYCGLSEYKEDTGSLYIPLLNVRPDYQSQKIGKKLLLHALEKTMALGWPRLDLYTWAGNTKAVPLYKKCGFFWEERDDVTHLMNFIPQVLTTPLLSSVFEELDWYETSERQIEVKPDGVKENGFTFYEYSWRNENKFARVQFERTGRGIHLIETDEFLIRMDLDNHEVIEQEQQKFQIKFINKTDAPVSFNLTGFGQDRVEYKIDEEMMVDKEANVSGFLTVKSGDEPSAWRTHPYLSVNASINGQQCELRLGVFPVQPAKVEASYSGNLCFLNNDTFIELEIKNNLKEDANFSVLFPENRQVILEKNQFSMFVPAGGRKTFSVSLTVKNYGFYNATISIIATKKNATELEFEQELTVAFKGFGEKFGGESKDYWHIYNGLCQVNIRKRDLLMTAARNSKKKQPIAFFPPKLGKPYSNEFSKKKPHAISWLVEDSSISLKMELESGEKEGMFIIQFIQLFADGLVHKWVEIENRGSFTHSDIAISSPGFHNLGKTYFPLENKVVYFSENRIIEFGDLRLESITGNWYFSENAPDPIGVCWSKNSKATPEGWQFVIEDELGLFEPGAKKTTEKQTLSIGAFQQWEDFKSYAVSSSTVEMSEVCGENIFESENVIANSKSELSLSLKSFRNSYMDGQLQIALNDKEIYQTVITPEEEKTSHALRIESSELEPISILKGEYLTNSMSTQIEELVLCPSNTEVTSQSISVDTFTVYAVNNGCITLKAAPDFYPGLFSINVNGVEWLDTSFPNVIAKSWWNPWAGGMKTFPSGLTTYSLMKEQNSASPSEIRDSKGNMWSGLAVSTEMLEHPEWKGVHFVQYYLMLPGVPVIATYLEVKESAGKNLKCETWNTDLFIGNEDLTKIKMNVSGNTNQYTAGVQELPMHFEMGDYFTSSSNGDKFYLVPSLYNVHAEAYTNKHAFPVLLSQSAIPSEKEIRTAPIFMVFDHRVLKTNVLKKLRGIQF